ncbi:MAG: hypothetical protein QN135_01520, partial [Armatimonadota bacterium]|nr:hypothetical protein [Armatimonadota bacterium]
GATGLCPHPNGTTNPTTGVTPVKLMPYDDTPNLGGEYKVWLIRSDHATIGSDGKTLIFDSRNAKTDNFKVRRRGNGQPPLVSITGYKWYDTNTNGTKDGDEVNIGGWRIEKTPPTPADVTYTSSIEGPGLGTYGFLVEANSGTYTISEVAPPPGFHPAGVWVPTTPTSGTVTVGSTDAAGPNFGNVCLGPTGGRTIGFWTNRNGQALIDADDLATLQALNLRNADGSHFDPVSAAELRTWLLNATATNMAYMLSAQLAAMALNVREGFVSGSGMLFVGVGFPGANAAGFISVNDLMALANASLGTDGNTPAGHPQRAYQEQLKNALDAANNNGSLLVQPGPGSCPPIPESY